MATILAAVGTYVTTRRDLQTQYDADLRTLRIEVYLDLWNRLKALNKYARSDTLSETEAERILVDLDQWYFDNDLTRRAHRRIRTPQPRLQSGRLGWTRFRSSSPQLSQAREQRLERRRTAL